MASETEQGGRRKNRDRGEPQLPMQREIDEIVVYRDDAREWRWRYVAAGNRAKLATGGEGYRNHRDLVETLKWLFGPDQIIWRAGRAVLFKWRQVGDDVRRLAIVWEDIP